MNCSTFLLKLRIDTQQLTEIIILSYNLAYNQNFKHVILPNYILHKPMRGFYVLCSLNIFRQVHRNSPTMFHCIKTKLIYCTLIINAGGSCHCLHIWRGRTLTTVQDHWLTTNQTSESYLNLRCQHVS